MGSMCANCVGLAILIISYTTIAEQEYHDFHGYCFKSILLRKWYVANALKFNQNSRLLFTKTLQWKCLSTKTLIG